MEDETQLVQTDLQFERPSFASTLSYIMEKKYQISTIYISLGLLEHNGIRRIVTKAITSYGHQVNNLEYLLLHKLLTAATSYDTSTMVAVTFIPWYDSRCRKKDECLNMLRRYINPSSYIFKMSLTKIYAEPKMFTQTFMHTYFEIVDGDIKMFPIYQIVEVSQSVPYGRSTKTFWRSFESGKIM